MLKGVDVSHYQGTIDWLKVKAAGMGFAFVKVTDGESWVDPCCHLNTVGARAAGLTVGAYHFFRPLDDAKTQAQHFIDTVDLLGGPFLVALDVEDCGDDWDQFTHQQIAEMVNTWLDTVQAAFRTAPFFYTNQPFADKYLTMVATGVYPLWLARYAQKVPAGWQNYKVWQESESGAVDGIPGKVDLDYANDGVDLSQYLSK